MGQAQTTMSGPVISGPPSPLVRSLPPELVEHVMAFVGAGPVVPDRKSLRSAALVCHQWATAAQSALARDLVVGPVARGRNHAEGDTEAKRWIRSDAREWSVRYIELRFCGAGMTWEMLASSRGLHNVALHESGEGLHWGLFRLQSLSGEFYPPSFIS